jgi:hypothetical protein
MRTLHKEHNIVVFQTGTGAPNQEAWFEDWFGTTQGEWFKIGPNNFFTIGTEQYIDLKGLAIDDMSVFFDAITTQTTIPPVIEGKVTGVNPPAGASIVLHDIITSVPLAINDELASVELPNGIGYNGSQYDFEHVIYYRAQTYSTDVDFGGNLCQLVSSTQSGSGMPTASDRLYCYRFVQWTTQVTNARVTIQPVRYVLAVTPRKESDLEYIYRLKRSYELQQSFDRD